MLGWEVFIHTEFTESTDIADWHWPKDENVLATWHTSVRGMDWARELAADGKARFSVALASRA
jgi:hypothetical protein